MKRSEKGFGNVVIMRPIEAVENGGNPALAMAGFEEAQLRKPVIRLMPTFLMIGAGLLAAAHRSIMSWDRKNMLRC
jgi:hypothetical protein